jgi:hypothetical protein
MPTPTKSYKIGVKVSGGTSGNDYAVFYNGRTGDKYSVKISNNEAVVNLGNTKEFPSGYQNGDLIDISITGRRYGGATHTVNTSKGGASIKITLSNVTTTNAPEVKIG